jgi:hypothetical protein
MMAEAQSGAAAVAAQIVPDQILRREVAATPFTVAALEVVALAFQRLIMLNLDQQVAPLGFTDQALRVAQVEPQAQLELRVTLTLQLVAVEVVVAVAALVLLAPEQWVALVVLVAVAAVAVAAALLLAVLAVLAATA